jgi:hypothetical protein
MRLSTVSPRNSLYGLSEFEVDTRSVDIPTIIVDGAATSAEPNPGGASDSGESPSGGDTGGAGTEVVIELLKGCGAGALAFVDGAIPFADPLASSGTYNPEMPGIGFSQQTGAVVSTFAGLELSAGALLPRGATWLATAAKAGRSLARTVSSGNRYMRLGLSNMGGGGKTPALRVGNAVSAWGRWLTHVDLRLTQTFSQTAPKQVKRVQQCLRLDR